MSQPIRLGLSIGTSLEGGDGAGKAGSHRPICASVRTPSGRVSPATVVAAPSTTSPPVASSTFFVEYQPKERGRHELELATDEAPELDDKEDTIRRHRQLPVSPVQLDVLRDSSWRFDDLSTPGEGNEAKNSRLKVSALLALEIRVKQTGLVLAIDKSLADASDITAWRPSSDNQQPQQVNGFRPGHCTVDHLPLPPGDYRLLVRLKASSTATAANQAPLRSKVITQPTGITQVAILGRQRCLKLPLRIFQAGDSSEPPLPNSKPTPTLTATIEDPNGTVQPCPLRRLPNGRLAVSVTPRVSGRHWVSVRSPAGHHAPNSPFGVEFAPADVADARRVRIEFGEAGRSESVEAFRAVVGIRRSFLVDVGSAGFGKLSVQMSGPGPVRLDVERTVDAGDGGVSGVCSVSYLAMVPGEYALTVRYGEHQVPESPWLVQVVAQGDAVPEELAVPRQRMEEEDQKVKNKSKVAAPTQTIVVSGPGLHSGDVNRPNQFFVELADGGSSIGLTGDFAVSVEGPSKACIEVDSSAGPSKYRVGWTVAQTGVYRIAVTLDGRHAIGSPSFAYIGDDDSGGESLNADESGAPRAFGEGLAEARVGQPAVFWLVAPRPSDLVSVSLNGPAKVRLAGRRRSSDSGEMEFEYWPPVAGRYSVSVRCGPDDRCLAHVKGSPFVVRVTDSSDSVSSLATASSSWLRAA